MLDVPPLLSNSNSGRYCRTDDYATIILCNTFSLIHIEKGHETFLALLYRRRCATSAKDNLPQSIPAGQNGEDSLTVCVILTLNLSASSRNAQ